MYKKPKLGYRGPDFNKSIGAERRRRSIRISTGMPRTRTGVSSGKIKINMGLAPQGIR